MVVVLTICSANYLAHALTLHASILKHGGDCRFVIGLVDKLPDFWKEDRPNCEVLAVDKLGMDNLAQLAEKYDIVELNTAVKPFYIQYLYDRDPSVSQVIYFDPDIVLFAELARITRKLTACSLLLTPHSCNPVSDDKYIEYEVYMLATGIYNLGFLGTSRCEESFRFLAWWRRRMVEYCYYRGYGLFVDQIWLTLAPLYYPGVCVDTDAGYNVSYWNLFERRLSKVNDRYLLNESVDLTFYHFSSYKPEKPEMLSYRSGGISLEGQPLLQELTRDYREQLMKNGYEAFRKLECIYKKPLPHEPAATVRTKLKKGLKKAGSLALRCIPKEGRRAVDKVAWFVVNQSREA